MRTSRKITLISIFSIGLFIAFPTTTHAFSFGELFDGVKKIFVPKTTNELSINSNIELVAQGDLNKNGVIDSGDTVRYSFTITNQTDKTYAASKLNTNVSTNDINTISNIKGAVSLDDSKKTVVIPNLTFTPNQFRIVSFEARVNYFKDNDKTLSSEAELIDETNKTLHKSEKKNVTVKKLDEEKFNKLLHITE